MSARRATRSALVLSLLAGNLAAANPYLADAKTFYSQARFEEALASLELARKVPSGDAAQKLEVLDLLARCQVAAGRSKEAEATYVEYLTLRPKAEIDRSLSPKILEAFDAAKSRLYPPDYLAIEPLPAPPGRLMFRLVDPWGKAASLVLGWRVGMGGAWNRLELLPSEESFGHDVESAGAEVAWFVEAHDASGREVAFAGTRPGLEEPPKLALTAPSPAGAKVSSNQATLRWALAGVALAAAAGGAYLWKQSVDSEQQAQLEEWGDSAQRHHSRAVVEQRWAIGLAVGSGAAVACAVLLTW